MTINCDQFDDRLNECLDQRRSIDDDPELAFHAAHCDCCDRKVRAWSQIESFVERSQQDEVRVDANRSSPSRWFAVAAIALASLTALAGYQLTHQDSFAVKTALSESEKRGQTPFVRSTLRAGSRQKGSDPFFLVDIDPMTWWHGVQQNDWVGQTMPVVRSVGEGVAPLGRSLMRAVTILTTGGPDQTS